MHGLLAMSIAVPFPSHVMSEGDHPTVEDIRSRRSGPSDAAFVGHVKATDAGLSLVWRWAQILTTLLCFGFTIGVVYTKFGITEKAIAELREDVRDSGRAYAALDKQTDRNTLAIASKEREINELKEQVRELRAVVNTMRDMREAYVYSSGKRNATPP